MRALQDKVIIGRSVTLRTAKAKQWGRSPSRVRVFFKLACLSPGFHSLRIFVYFSTGGKLGDSEY